MLINVASNVLVAGRGRRAVRQRPSEPRALHHLSRERRHDRARGRQRAPVRQMRRRARPSRMGRRSPLQLQSRPGGKSRRWSTAPSRRCSPADTADAWIAKLKAVGVPCGRINTAAEALADPHTAARRMIETVQHPTVGELKLVGMPYKFSDTPASVRLPPPTARRAHRGNPARGTRPRRSRHRRAAQRQGGLMSAQSLLYSLSRLRASLGTDVAVQVTDVAAAILVCGEILSLHGV